MTHPPPLDTKDRQLAFVAGQMLSFRLLANPTKKLKADGRKNGIRVGLVTEEERLAWLPPLILGPTFHFGHIGFGATTEERVPAEGFRRYLLRKCSGHVRPNAAGLTPTGFADSTSRWSCSGDALPSENEVVYHPPPLCSVKTWGRAGQDQLHCERL